MKISFTKKKKKKLININCYYFNLLQTHQILQKKFHLLALLEYKPVVLYTLQVHE